ncbi:MAG: helix-turn-helix domain-containing protein [Anaerolineae bacterium]|nr:helix-turn-helix domain-containing protein [Anaerolineae bacterium]
MNQLTPVASNASTLSTSISTSIATTPSHSAVITARQLFSGWIRRRRKSLDLTQADLAQRLSCSLSTVQKVEEGGRRPSRALVERLADALEIHPDERAAFTRVARPSLMPGRKLEQAPEKPATATAKIDRHSGPSLRVWLETVGLLGRDADMHRLMRLIERPDVRLITITGEGGVGKTALAQNFVRGREENGHNDVTFVPLRDIATQTDEISACNAVAKAIMLACGQPMQPERDVAEQLMTLLRNRNDLLILDNFEHVVAARSLVIRLLQQTRHLKLIVTSRERLQIRAEYLVQLTGLSVSSTSAQSFTGESASQINMPCPAPYPAALQLFINRAQRISSHPMDDEATLFQITRICNLVDGLPLGIELAAELIATHTLNEIADAIKKSFDVLISSNLDVPPEQSSLRSVFDASWRLLTAQEQHVLVQCSAFRDGFSSESADPVIEVDSEDTPTDESMTRRRILNRLMAQSLLRRSTEGSYTMHPLLRAYAQEKLNTGRRNLLQSQHVIAIH